MGREVENSKETIFFSEFLDFGVHTLEASISELSGSTKLCFGYVSDTVGGSPKKWSSPPPTIPTPGRGAPGGGGLQKVENVSKIVKSRNFTHGSD